MRHAAHVEPAIASALSSDPALAWRETLELDVVRVLAKSRTTEASVVVLAGGMRAVRKRWTWPRGRDRLKGALRTTWVARSPARREFDALARLRALPAGAFAPRPLAWMDERAGGVLRACMLLLEEIDGAADLAHWLISRRSAPARARALSLLARRVRAMHDAGLVDRELHPRNVLVFGDGRVVLKVDCAKQRVARGAASFDGRARDLAALDVGLVRLASPEERSSFFRCYAAGGEGGIEPRALLAAVERERIGIDDRESRRLPRSDK